MDVNWLATLLTGNPTSSRNGDAVINHGEGRFTRFFAAWLVAWSRKIVISRALASVRGTLRASARATESRRMDKTTPPQDLCLDPNTTPGIHVERALLAIDIFPRCALALSAFEGLSVEDVSILLDCAPNLVRKAQVVAAEEFGGNLAAMQRVLRSEAQHA